MLLMRPRKILGMMIEPQAVEVAEVIVGKSLRVVRSDRFEFPAGTSFDTPDDLGKKLGQFLHANRYAAKKVVIGLPGRWTLLKAKSLPPCNTAAAAAMLRLAIERDYHDTAREWSFDFLMQSSDSQGVNVLLAAAPRSKILQIVNVIEAAGLTALAAVPAQLTLAGAQTRQGDAAAIYLSDQSNEVAIWKTGRLIAVDRLVAPLDSPERFANELSRALAVHEVKPEAIELYDQSSGNNQAAADAWQRELSLPVRVIESTVNNADAKESAAAALARLWYQQPALLIDFLHSRVQAAAASRFKRLHVLGACAVLAILLGTGYLSLDWYMQWRSVNDLQGQLAAMKTRLVIAHADVDRLSHARGWYDNRPSMLNGIRALTLAFPNTGQVWTTSLIMRDDLTGTLAAKAEDEKAAIKLIETLRATAGFTEVKMLYLRKADRTTRTVSFALNFSYTGKD